jgi:hypothetical protein
MANARRLHEHGRYPNNQDCRAHHCGSRLSTLAQSRQTLIKIGPAFHAEQCAIHIDRRSGALKKMKNPKRLIKCEGLFAAPDVRKASITLNNAMM